jgi:hypothetical protein
LIEDLDEGKVFLKKIQTRKRQEIFWGAITISVRYSNIPRDLCSFQFMRWAYFKSHFLDLVKISSF